MRCDRIWRNARLATLDPKRNGLGIVENGLLACRDGLLIYVGPEAEAPGGLEGLESIDCGGRWITPGLIDCHTHLVYAGNRAREFERRLQGATYAEIAKQGGGILSTVAATRAASEAELVTQSLPRLDALLAEGVTTVEIKSGYGLALEHERKQLRAARALGSERPVTIQATFLGAHALPPEFVGRADDYITEVSSVMLPALAREGLVDAVDAYCEDIGFSREQVNRLFNASAALGVRVKLHAEQLSNSHGAGTAAAFRALSADHLEYLDREGVEAMAAANTVAVLLPGAFYFLRETRLPPINLLRAHSVSIALATDCNPGTSPLTSLLLVMNMAATLFQMTVEECLVGVTRAAAQALGLSRRVGTLEEGKQCDLAIWDIEQPADLVYRMGFNPLHSRVWKGQ